MTARRRPKHRPAAPSSPEPSPPPRRNHLRAFDFALLLATLALLAARFRLQESLTEPFNLFSPASPDTGFAGPVAYVLFSGAFVTLFALWLLVHAFTRTLTWRPTRIAIPIAMLALAGAIATAYASDRHLALLATLGFLSQALLALLLLQLLDSPARRRLLLAAIAASGALMAARTLEQVTYDIPATQQSFDQDPDQVLLRQGIEPGSYAAHLYTARIASGDVAGYFGISNIAGAFFLLTLGAAVALILTALFEHPTDPRRVGLLLLAIALTLLTAAGLLLTRSKGAIGATAIATLFAGAVAVAHKPLARHWRKALLALALLALLAAATIAAWGLTQGRLPTNSLWVRWQYWSSTARMVADHPFTGVGPLNFSQYYPRYMPPGAPETVAYPHSFVLNLLSEWGPLGLAAFLLLLATAAVRLARPTPHDLLPPQGPEPPLPAWAAGLAIAAIAALLHYAATDLTGLDPITWISVATLSLALPAVFWFVAFLIFAALAPTNHAPRLAEIAWPLVLAATLLGFLVHGTIELALFQPATGTLFIVLLALALSCRPDPHPNPADLGPRPRRLALVLPAALALLAATFATAIPTLREYSLLDQARTQLNQPGAAANATSTLQNAHALARRATNAAPLDPLPATAAAHIAQQLFLSDPSDASPWLEETARHFEIAIQRDPANPAWYAQLRDLYLLAAQHNPDHRLAHARRAILYAREHLRRAPHNPESLLLYARLLLDYGRQLDLPDYRPLAADALTHALDAETALEQQLREMFPQETPLTRLTEQQKKWARARLHELTGPNEAPPVSMPAPYADPLFAPENL